VKFPFGSVARRTIIGIEMLGERAIFDSRTQNIMDQSKLGGLSSLSDLLKSSAPEPATLANLGIVAQARKMPMQSATLASIFGLAAPPTEQLNWMYVTDRFKTFQDNLALTPNQVNDGITKYKNIVGYLNKAYWGIASDTENAFLIGSWAKGTCIRPPRDVDLYFVLPPTVYGRFQTYSSNINKQSALLQEVKGKLQALPSYWNSDIKGDGPVVLADFTSYSVEIVPAFLLNYDDRSFYVCDTKNGGKYMMVKPLHEVDAIDEADARSNCNVRRLIRMLKCWQSYCSVPIKSFYLELLVIDFLDQWEYKSQSFFFYDWMCRDFFEWMITKVNSFVFAPGTWEVKWLGDAWKSRAESAYGRALKACDYERRNDMLNAGDEWQKIFGIDIPKTIV
jgi:hypothetical protein